MSLDCILGRSVPVQHKGLPTVSMLMITYGRCCKQPEMLNEALFWCVNQQYPNVEVLVLNDAPEQKLVCSHPRVRIVNWPTRIPDLGSKMNLAVTLAAGSICCPAEDDDISLPNRAAQAYHKLRDGYEYWAPKLWLYAHIGQEPVIDGNGYGYTSSAYRRDSVMGRHPSAIKGHDMEMAIWSERNLKVNKDIITDPHDVSYVYRWGNSLMHLSGTNDPVAAFTNNHPGRPGTYEIQPIMKEDWAEEKAAAAPRWKGR